VWSILKIPAVFDPVGAFLVRRAELARVGGVDALGDEPLENLGLPEPVEVLQGLPIVVEVRASEWALKNERAICWRRHAIELPAFKSLACFSAWVYRVCK
jgi:hypothetical protein